MLPDPSPSSRETREQACPYGGSAAVGALGRIRAARTEIHSEYRCRACRKEFVFLRTIGLSTSPHESDLITDDAFLRDKAQAAIRAGKIPAPRPGRTWGGRGIGAACDICRRPIVKRARQLVQFAHAGADAELLHVHPRCFAVWEQEWKLHPERR